MPPTLINETVRGGSQTKEKHTPMQMTAIWWEKILRNRKRRNLIGFPLNHSPASVISGSRLRWSGWAVARCLSASGFCYGVKVFHFPTTFIILNTFVPAVLGFRSRNRHRCHRTSHWCRLSPVLRIMRKWKTLHLPENYVHNQPMKSITLAGTAAVSHFPPRSAAHLNR